MKWTVREEVGFKIGEAADNFGFIEKDNHDLYK
jgi:hypothetical protein